MIPRTHVILDGLQDPLHAQDLSARWASAGFNNAVDITGQSAWIELKEPMREGAQACSTENETDLENISTATPANSDPTPHTPHPTPRSLLLAASIARAFGVELRERVGTTFKPDNDLPALRDQMSREYRARFAQGLVFGLPALVVHYLAPILSSGGGQSAGNLAFPWLLELVLVGWALWVAALPILWQGIWSLIHLRPTADLLTTTIILVAYLPSAFGVASLLFTSEPWFGVMQPDLPTASTKLSVPMAGPAFHIAIMAVLLATCQRWLMHIHIESLSGRADYMMKRFGPLIALWLLAMIITSIIAGWQVGLCLGLLLPPLMSSAAINRISPGWSAVLPVLAFAPVFLFGPRSLAAIAPAESLRFEIATGFAWMMVAVMTIGWRTMRRKPA